jgi:hypothetical protein
MTITTLTEKCSLSIKAMWCWAWTFPKISRKEHATWRWNNVFAFIPGTWMKELIEMAAHIEASQEQYFEDFTDKDVIERARQIKF